MGTLRCHQTWLENPELNGGFNRKITDYHRFLWSIFHCHVRLQREIKHGELDNPIKMEGFLVGKSSMNGGFSSTPCLITEGNQEKKGDFSRDSGFLNDDSDFWGHGKIMENIVTLLLHLRPCLDMFRDSESIGVLS